MLSKQGVTKLKLIDIETWTARIFLLANNLNLLRIYE